MPTVQDREQHAFERNSELPNHPSRSLIVTAKLFSFLQLLRMAGGRNEPRSSGIAASFEGNVEVCSSTSAAIQLSEDARGNAYNTILTSDITCVRRKNGQAGRAHSEISSDL